MTKTALSVLAAVVQAGLGLVIAGKGQAQAGLPRMHVEDGMASSVASDAGGLNAVTFDRLRHLRSLGYLVYERTYSQPRAHAAIGELRRKGYAGKVESVVGTEAFGTSYPRTIFIILYRTR